MTGGNRSPGFPLVLASILSPSCEEPIQFLTVNPYQFPEPDGWNLPLLDPCVNARPGNLEFRRNLRHLEQVHRRRLLRMVRFHA